jgi:hypothetical protein
MFLENIEGADLRFYRLAALLAVPPASLRDLATVSNSKSRNATLLFQSSEVIIL